MPLMRNKLGLNYLQAYVSIIKGIARIRVVQIENKYYIVDIEENTRFFFIPLVALTTKGLPFIWLFAVVASE